MSDQPSSRNPEPEELLQTAIRYFLDDVHTSMPGRVETYDPATQKVSVKPLIKRRVVTEDGQEFVEALPIIPDVPVQFPRTQRFFLTFPLEPGDLVMLHFAERSLDNWLSGTGEDTDPQDFRGHDLSDAVAVPGLYPFSEGIRDIDGSRMAMGADNGGMQIHFDPEKIEFTKDGVAGKHLAIVEALEALWAKQQAIYDAHTHPTGMGPSGPPAVPSEAWDPNINSSRMGIPDG